MYSPRIPLKTLLVAFIVLVACGPGGDTAPPMGGDAGRGTDSIEFEVETFEGKTISLAEQRGTPVVLNFWESW